MPKFTLTKTNQLVKSVLTCTTKLTNQPRRFQKTWLELTKLEKSIPHGSSTWSCSSCWWLPQFLSPISLWVCSAFQQAPSFHFVCSLLLDLPLLSLSLLSSVFKRRRSVTASCSPTSKTKSELSKTPNWTYNAWVCNWDKWTLAETRRSVIVSSFRSITNSRSNHSGLCSAHKTKLTCKTTSSKSESDCRSLALRMLNLQNVSTTRWSKNPMLTRWQTAKINSTSWEKFSACTLFCVSSLTRSVVNTRSMDLWTKLLRTTYSKLLKRPRKSLNTNASENWSPRLPSAQWSV